MGKHAWSSEETLKVVEHVQFLWHRQGDLGCSCSALVGASSGVNAMVEACLAKLQGLDDGCV